MRAFVSSMVAGVLSVGAVWSQPVSPVFAASVSTTDEDPAQLYDQGRKSYRLGDFEDAVKKWERAYELSDRPLLLYNISLAYKGLYGITKDVADLRRARAVLDNFIKLAEADPELEVDDAHERLAEVDSMIADVERSSTSATTSTDPTPVTTTTTPTTESPPGPATPDPGRTFRAAGIGLMAGGGVLLVAGVATGAYFSVKSQDFETELNRYYGEQTENQCDPSASVQSGTCSTILENIRRFRRNGQGANTGAIVSFAVMGGIGAASLATGAALFVIGKRRTAAWKQSPVSHHALRFHTFHRGIAISGRF